MKPITIKFVKIPLEWGMSDRKIKELGGVKVVQELLYDILERYGNEEYFNPELVDELRRNK